MSVEQIAALPVVRQAAQIGEELTQLWPLQSALHMDNDVKYAENLQVRISRMGAQIITDQDVTVADAEFVYEGAETIPGRPQKIVDALVAVNDAIDILTQYSESQDLELLFEAADALTTNWSDSTRAAIQQIITATHGNIDEELQHNTPTLAWKYSAVLQLFAALLNTVVHQINTQLGSDAPHAGGAPEDRVKQLEQLSLPFIPFINEFAESLAVPKLFITAAQYHGIIAAFDTPNGDTDDSDAAIVLAQVLAPLTAAEWRKHREEVLWDPAEAKKLAKEEDERKNKEALAAKFAHIKDDPNKPEVEL